MAIRVGVDPLKGLANSNDPLGTLTCVLRGNGVVTGVPVFATTDGVDLAFASKFRGVAVAMEFLVVPDLGL